MITFPNLLFFLNWLGINSNTIVGKTLVIFILFKLWSTFQVNLYIPVSIFIFFFNIIFNFSEPGQKLKKKMFRKGYIYHLNGHILSQSPFGALCIHTGCYFHGKSYKNGYENMIFYVIELSMNLDTCLIVCTFS